MTRLLSACSHAIHDACCARKAQAVFALMTCMPTPHAVRDACSTGKTQAVFVLTKFQSQRFEFIFTSLGKNTSGLFQTLMAVFKAYDNSRLYRDLKLRGESLRL